MMTIVFEKLDAVNDNRKVLDELIGLSQLWADEKTCPSYTPNQREAFCNRELYIAKADGAIVAYALGDIKELTEETSYNAIGELAFELDELYVLPAYRRQGVGKALFQFMEADLCGKVAVIGTIATSYRYLELLKFYSEDLGMSFNHALLTKRLS